MLKCKEYGMLRYLWVKSGTLLIFQKSCKICQKFEFYPINLHYDVTNESLMKELAKFILAEKHLAYIFIKISLQF